MSTALIQHGQIMERDPSHEVRVKIGLRNNRLISMREKHGWSQMQAAEEIGIAKTRLNTLECMRIPPFNEKKRRWGKSAIICAEFYGVSPEWLFPEALKLICTRDITFSGNVSQLPSYLQIPQSSEILALPASAVYDRKEAMKIISNALNSLTTKEEKVLRMLFFEGLSLRDIGLEFGVSYQNIDHIKARALHKLRHPWRNRELKEFVNEN